MASNIDTTAELNKLIQQQNQLYLTQAKIMKGQMAMLQQIAGLFQSIDPRQFVDGWTDTSKAIDEAEKSLEKMSGTSQQTLGSLAGVLKQGSGGVGVFSGALTKMGKGLMALATPVGIISMLSDGLDTAGNAAMGLVNIIGSVASAIGDLAVAIITAPFKMFMGLINGIGAGSTELRQALEDVRKTFGDLRTGASRAILDISKGMKGQLAETGLRVYRIFGNLAEKLKTITEYAGQLGPMFNNLAKSLVANAEAFGAYVKGLGLTEDGMKGVGRLALTTGKSFTEVGREITSMAFGMGKAFGINGKQISRAVGDMLQDVKNFGSLSIKSLTSIAVYANKLGLDFKELQGVIDQFDNFEQAADAAAQLSQAFGLNVDAMKLIQEQDPAARFDTLRKAFYQTGKSVEQMSRQELKLLASQTGLSEEAVKLGFSIKNQGVNYKDVQKQSDLTSKKQLSQADAMHELAGSIERLVKSGDMGHGGFFDRFFQGFLRGISMTKEFREMMRTLRRALYDTFQAGRQLGQVFVHEFPGVKDVFKGISDFFNRDRWRSMLHGVVSAFKKFFKQVLTDPEGGLRNLFKKLQDVFFNNFDTKKEAGKKIVAGIGLFYKTVFRVGLAAIKLGLEGIGTAIKAVFSGGGNGRVMTMIRDIGGGLLDILKSAFQELSKGGVYLKDAFIDFYVKNWPMVVKGLEKFFSSKGSSDFGKALSSLFDSLGSIAGVLGNMFIDFLGTLPWKKIGGWVATKLGELLVAALVTMVAASVALMLAPFAIVVGGIYLLFHDTFDDIVSTVVNFGKSIYNVGKSLFDDISSVAMSILGPIGKWIMDNLVLPVGRAFMAINTAWETHVSRPLREAMASLAVKVYNTIQALVQSIVQSDFYKTLKGMITPILEAFNVVKKVGSDLTDNIRRRAQGTEDVVQRTTAMAARAQAVLIAERARQQTDMQTQAIRSANDAAMKSQRDAEAHMTRSQRIHARSQARANATILATQADHSRRLADVATKATPQAPGKMGEGGTEGVNMGDIERVTSQADVLSQFARIHLPTAAQLKNLQKSIGMLRDTYANNIVKGVKDLIAAANSVTTDLNGIGDTPARINVQLKEFANHLGVGGTSKLEIKNRNFTINLNVNVVVDADEFESALTSRPGGSHFVVKGET